uniref:Uncharacterized protein n=1 Tax=Zea mays TaxID=4577 RepID=A0A804QAS8_MAIZE
MSRSSVGRRMSTCSRLCTAVCHTIAPEDDDLIILCRQNVGLAGIVDPRVVFEHVTRGLVVALPGDEVLEPGLAILHGDLGHLRVLVEQLGGAIHGGAVEPKARVDRALRVQAERVRDVDLAAPRRAAGTPPRRRRRRRGKHPYGRKAREQEEP